MAKTYTTNYGFTKDDPNDPYNVYIVNDNLDEIDNKIKAASESGSGVKTIRFVIGTSASGWTANDCDYLCDGTDDQVEINNAIQALPATGGEIVILDGTYNIKSRIVISQNNISIKGNGKSTILKRMYSEPSEYYALIYADKKDNINISNLSIDGNKVTYYYTGNSGIRIEYSNYYRIFDIFITESSGAAIRAYGCSNFSIYNNVITNSSTGILVQSGAYFSIFNNNAKNNDSFVISLYGTKLIINSNISVDNTTGIRLSYSCNSNIYNNIIIRGSGLETDYTAAQNTIYLAGSDNIDNFITMNACVGKAPTVDGGTGNTIKDNKWNASGDVYDATITTTWTGSVAPYTQEVTITGFTAYDMPQIIPVYSTTNATAILEKEAWNMISKAETGANKITFTCFEDKPTTAINVKVRRG